MSSCTAACATVSAVRGAPGTAGHCRHCNLHAVLLWLHGDRQRLLALGLLLAQGFEPAIQEVR